MRAGSHFFVTMQHLKTQNGKTSQAFASKVGRPLSYTPETLEAKFEEYAQWAKENPRYNTRVLADGTLVRMPLERPLTLAGFCIYAGIVPETFRNLEAREEFFCICARVRARIESDQLEGALCEQFNPAIASRVLKLADRTEATVEVRQPRDLTPEEAAAFRAKLETEY